MNTLILILITAYLVAGCLLAHLLSPFQQPIKVADRHGSLLVPKPQNSQKAELEPSNWLEKALRDFCLNRQEAERYLKDHLAILNLHQHSVFCFRWSWCRQLESINHQLIYRIGLYQRAEEGLRAGNPIPAILALDFLISNHYESSLTIAHRWTHSPEPTPMSIRCDRVGTWKSLNVLRAKLASEPRAKVTATILEQ